MYFTPVNYAPVNPVEGYKPSAAPATVRETVVEGKPAPGTPPALVAVKSAEFRCPECNAKLAENTVTGMQVRCGRCKVVREAGQPEIAA
jgi:DNA polymerase II large subunit